MTITDKDSNYHHEDKKQYDKKKILQDVIELIKSDPDLRLELKEALLHDDLTRFDQIMLEIKKLREDFQKQTEQSNKKLETFEKRMEEMREDFNKQFEAFSQRLDNFEKRMDAFEKRMDAFEKRMDAFEKRMEEMREDFNKQFEAFSQRLDNFEKRLDDFETRFNLKLTAMGARWGIDSEEAFRNGVRILLGDFFGIQVSKWEVTDEEGVVFGDKSRIEIDVLIHDGIHVLIEIKSAINKSDVATLLRKAVLYKKTTNIEPKLMIITPFIEDNALEYANKKGIIISNALDSRRGDKFEV